MSQIMIVIGGFVLLSMLSLHVNNTILAKADEAYASQNVIVATTLAQGLIQEISLKDFDEKTTGGFTADSVGALTLPANLGKDGVETFATYDDIDDYKSYTRFDTVRNGVFKSRVDVYYVNGSTLNYSAVQTYYKKVSVSTTDTASSGALKKMTVPITLINIYSY